MKRRHLQFDALESKTLLSSTHLALPLARPAGAERSGVQQSTPRITANGGTVTARQAISQVGIRPNNGGGTGTFPFAVDDSEFRVRGGRTRFELEFRAGGFRFDQEFTMRIRRDRDSVPDGSITARDAIDLFFDELNARADAFQANPGGGFGGGLRARSRTTGRV